MQSAENFDVVVIGGGPAGAVAGRQAAQLGLRTIVIEKAEFPRFHIGESLLPYMSGLLNQLGLLDAVRKEGHTIKSDAEFSNTKGDFHRVCFTDQGEGRFHTTFHVERSKFDNLLLKAAAEAGAEIVQPCETVKLQIAEGDDNHVVTVSFSDKDARTLSARFVIDASGRAGVIAKQLDLRKRVEQLQMVAVYRHFDDVAEDDNPGHEGDVQIGNHSEGWVWGIPQRYGSLSVGAVMRKNTLAGVNDKQALFEKHVSRVPRIAQRLRRAVPVGPVKQEADFCYLSNEVVGNRWFMVGDAAAFVDPVFSGGVYLAMTTGMQAAKNISSILQGFSSMEEVKSQFTSLYKTGYDTYFRLVQGFYDYNFDFGSFKLDLPDTVDNRSVSLLLGGDFWGQVNTFSRELRKHEKWRVFEPFDVYYGCPAYPELELQERTTYHSTLLEGA